MNALLQAADEIQNFLRSAGESFCFIGGVALQRWGEPRFTRDVDLIKEFAPLAALREESQATARLSMLKDKYAA